MKGASVISFLLLVGILDGRPSVGSIYDRNGKRLPDFKVSTSEVNWDTPKPGDHAEWGAVGLLAGAGYCSATYFDSGSPSDGPAYVITSGHCVYPMPKPDAVLVNKPLPLNYRFIPNYFVGTPQSQLTPIKVRRLVYATMKHTDLAILELTKTRAELSDELGLKPFALAERPAPVGEPIQNLGFPTWRIPRNMRGLRHSICEAGETVPVREMKYDFSRSIRHRCSGVGGNSGSPLLSLRTGQILGLFNTGGTDGSDAIPCSEDHPCEVESDGKTSIHLDENYAQDATPAALCFDSRGGLDLNRPGCRLEKP